MEAMRDHQGVYEDVHKGVVGGIGDIVGEAVGVVEHDGSGENPIDVAGVELATIRAAGAVAAVGSHEIAAMVR